MLRVLKSLRDKGLAEYYYTQYSILEIFGKVGRVRYDRDRVMIGLRAIEEKLHLNLGRGFGLRRWS